MLSPIPTNRQNVLICKGVSDNISIVFEKEFGETVGMSANAITVYRLILTFIVLAIFGTHTYISIACIVTILIIFIMDSVDGMVARRKNQTSAFGAVFDIVADRIVENVFWIYFAYKIEFIPLWMPIIVVTRGLLTDGIRSIALTEGKAPFEMMTIPWAQALTSSRTSRSIYGVAKMVAFLLLPTVFVLLDTYPDHPITDYSSLAALVLAYIAVVMCLIRGIPVLIDGWRYVKK